MYALPSRQACRPRRATHCLALATETRSSSAEAGPSTSVSGDDKDKGCDAQRDMVTPLSRIACDINDADCGAKTQQTVQPFLRRAVPGTGPPLREGIRRAHILNSSNRQATMSSPASLADSSGDDMDFLIREMGRKCGVKERKRKRVSFDSDIAVIDECRRVKARTVSEPYKRPSRLRRKSPT
ncbi:hypothetical protein BD626DRAFT_506407 [Schizophyllum amplum]|uniref:Uncharacterized protein n=1 Tax=Schizophyllum amplum TaxID=97359 RepID=A0A550C5N8_9AGAR|nr:hypothetical protein BD626DRAFT_506407 [Auriculariopsis ampla]